MLHWFWISLVWAGAGLTGNLLVLKAVIEMSEDRRPPPRGGRLVPAYQI